MARLRAAFVLLLQILTINAYVEVDHIENVYKSALPTLTRIVSGWEAYPGQFPHQAALRYTLASGELFTCGASIIHRKWLLTAAYCTLQPTSITVTAGATNISSPDPEYRAVTSTWYRHPDYNANAAESVRPNDISLVLLPTPLTFSDLIQPIRLQTSKDKNNDYDGLTLIASGYGRTWTDGPYPDVLNWVYLNGISNENCFLTYGSVIVDSTICAKRYNVTSQSTCTGDSGGPLVHVDSSGHQVLIGISSFVAGGSFGCHSGLPAGFVRPGHFHNWLTNVTGITFEDYDQITQPEPESQPDLELESEELESESEEQEPTVPEPETTLQPTPETTTPQPEPVTTPQPEPESTPQPEPEPELETEVDLDEEDTDLLEDKDLCNLLKRLQIIVNVKVNINKYAKKNNDKR